MQFKQYWKYIVAGLLSLALVSGGSYYAGRHSNPSKIEQKTTQTAEKVKDSALTQKDDTKTDTQKDKKEVTDTVKKRVIVTKKDGTTVTTETEHTHTGVDTEIKKVVDEKKDTTVQVHETERIVTKTETKIEYYSPKWNVAAIVLAQPQSLFDPSTLKYGLQVQYNVFWHVNVGMLALANPTDLLHTQVGASLGFSF